MTDEDKALSDFAELYWKWIDDYPDMTMTHSFGVIDRFKHRMFDALDADAKTDATEKAEA